ncbi:MAG: methyltransferase domain-containing protein [Bdellovibrio bacteriovorus]
MATTAPIHFNVNDLRTQVIATYEQVARDPNAHYHFHRGADYAHDFLGYDREELATIPTVSTERFAGVGNPLAIGSVAPGSTVLDHACGAGMDLLLAARRVGPAGRAIGVDATPAMVQTATEAARQAGLADIVQIHQGFYESLPVPDASVDLVISNGVLNLAPDKSAVLNEVYRVLKPGGRLYLADVVVQRELTLAARSNPELWAACIAGALVESELPVIAAQSGLIEGRVVRRFNCFYDTTAEAKVAKDLFIQSVNFHARKPDVGPGRHGFLF